MRQPDSLSTKTAPLLHLFNRNKASTVSFQNDTLTIFAKSGRVAHSLRVSEIEEVQFQKLTRLTRLTVSNKRGRAITVNGLQRGTSERLYAQLSRRVEQVLDDKAQAIGPEIIAVRDSIATFLTGEQYLRHSQGFSIKDSVTRLARRAGKRTRRKLDADAGEALRWLEATTEPSALEDSRSRLNETFLESATPRVHEATRDMFRTGLTDEQARNIATDEDVTLVLAGAGTGKTAVITGKIAHLVRNQGIPPESILALAFNRKAALEIRERLPDDLKGAQVSTFHSFALKVVASAGTAPTISKLAQDQFAYTKALDGILARMMTDPRKAKAIIEMVSSFPIEYRAPFDFSNRAEYARYIQDAEPRTLNGELVKSFEELKIANFLAVNGVAYAYEKPYEFHTATSKRRQYQPDFFLPDHGIYIEHFALNEEGQAPPRWTAYVAEAQWKRATHAQHRTKLIETYSWQYRKGMLEGSLEHSLKGHGVKFNPVPTEELVKKLSRERLSRLSHLLGTFLNHAKSGDLDHEEILKRGNAQKDKDRTQCFFEIFRDVREAYEGVLKEEGAVDFHDLINGAVRVIQEGGWDNPFKNVLIDEFQDISNGRMNLAKVLKQPGTAYFLVGDDWQSIYRFAGSYVGLIHQTTEYLGFTKWESLTKTFRFGDGILRPSTVFVQQNPEQTKRRLEAHDPDKGQHIKVIVGHPDTGLQQALRDIEELRNTPRESVMVLGRYRNSRSVLAREKSRMPNVVFSTAHSTKGQEADYVVVLDLRDNRYGFPCRVEDDPLLGIVMPPIHGDPYPFAEERRLFYVALTRAKKGVYLVADPVGPSPFVRELLENCPEVKGGEALRPRCPMCAGGSLIPSQGGRDLRCSNFPRCQHVSPTCPGCSWGYVSSNQHKTQVGCSNSACDHAPRVCPRCRYGILVVRADQVGLLECSSFQATSSCTYTERVVRGRGKRGRMPVRQLTAKGG